MPHHFDDFKISGTYMCETRSSVIARKHKAARNAVESLPLRALCVVVDTNVNDVLAENARLRAQVEVMDRELEIWCGGAIVPEVGCHYSIDTSVLSCPGFRAAFWADSLNSEDIGPGVLAAHGVVATDTHKPHWRLAFRYLGAETSTYTRQATSYRKCEHFLDRMHRFAAPFLGAEIDYDCDADECPDMYTEEGHAVVEIRQTHLHSIGRLDDGEDEVRPTGARGVEGGLPAWLAWYKR